MFQILNFSSSMGRKTFVIKSSIFSRYYSDLASDKPNIETIGVCNSNPLDPEKTMITYGDASSLKLNILEENKGKSGIYMFTNKETKDFYTGQSRNLYNRFLNYFNPAYLKRERNSRIGRALLKYDYSNFSLSILEYCDKADLNSREQYYIDKLNPIYNILKIVGAHVETFTHSKETKKKISDALKKIRTSEASPWFGRTRSEETKATMSLKKLGENNNMYGKNHTEDTKDLMRQKALGRKHSEETKLLMSSKHGSFVEVYERCDKEGFKLIGSFVSARKAGKSLGMSGSTVMRYLKSGEIFKDRYKFMYK